LFNIAVDNIDARCNLEEQQYIILFLPLWLHVSVSWPSSVVFMKHRIRYHAVQIMFM